MPRKTPVRELQKEEPVVSSPLRRSSRLNTNSPVPTKVLTRRSSASELPISTATVTRSRRSSLSQETQSDIDVQSDKKKPTSAIKTRRSSQTQNNGDSVQEEPVQKSRTRGSSVPKEQTSEVKKTTRRRTSIAEDQEVDTESTKKVTKSRSSSLTKKDDDNVTNKKQTSSVKEAAVSTPVKKKSSSPQTPIVILESIEEINKEADSLSEAIDTKGKKKNIEASRIEFDLSIINEASFVEEEMSPQKKNQSKLETGEESDSNEKKPELENNLKETVLNTQKDVLEAPKTDIPEPDTTSAKMSVPNDAKKGIEELDSPISDTSFNLQLSSSVLESSNKTETGALDNSNKENVCPKSSVEQSESEPMDDDDSVLESPKKYIEKNQNEIGQKLLIAEKVTDEIANFLSEEIELTSKQKTKEGKIESQTGVGEDTDLPMESTAENERSYISLEKSFSDVTETTQVEPETVLEKGTENSDNAETTRQKNGNEFVSTNVGENLNLVNEADKTQSQTTLNDSKNESGSMVLEEENDLQEQCLRKEVDQSVIVAVVQRETEIIPGPVHSESISSEKNSESNMPLNKLEAANSVENSGIIEQVNGKILSQSENLEIKVKDTSEVEVVVAESSSSDAKVSSEEVNITNNEENKISRQDSDVESPEIAEKSDKTDTCDILESEPALDVNKKIISKDSNSSDTKNDTADSSPENVENIVNEEDPSTDKNLDSEVSRIIENKLAMSEETKIEIVQENKTINLCDSESDQDVNLDSCEDDDSYRSPVKKLRSHLSLSDDEIFTRKEKIMQKCDIFERSLDSECHIPVRTKTIVIEKKHTYSTDEVIEIDDKNEEKEPVENSDQAGYIETTKNIENDVKDTDSRNVKKETEVCAENSILRNSSRKRSLDKTSIVLQETIQAGDDPEKSLSGRIHNVVDLFCAGLKNKSDISVNVSFECAGQGSDVEDENKTKVIEISFSASGIDGREVETQKGSKRRKVCRDSDHSSESSETHDQSQTTDQDISQTPSKASEIIADEVKEVTSAKRSKKRRSSRIPCDSVLDVHQSTPKLSETADKGEIVTSGKKKKKRNSIPNQSSHNNTFETSISIHEETDSSAKKSKKRKSIQRDISDSIQVTDTDATKTSFKTSVTFDVDDKMKSAEKGKTRKSTTDNSEDSVAENQKNSPIKKKLTPGTPFKLPDGKGKSDAESSDATAESSDDEYNDESVVSESQDSQYYDKLLSTSLVESDANDTTWIPGTETFASGSDSDMDSDVDEEIVSVEEESLIIEGKRRTKGSSYSSTDDVFVDAVVEKEKSPDKKKKRKLFRLSRYDVSQAIASPESEENELEILEPKNKRSEEINDEKHSSKTKGKKSKHASFTKSKNVKNMLPETSEIQASTSAKKHKKRKDLVSHKSEEEAGRKRKIDNTEDSVPKKKMGKGFKNKCDLAVQIKPSAGNRKNVNPLSMRPSTKTTSDWDVTSF